MHATLPLLKATDFPPITRRALDTLQVNLGYRCNQACHHCHVNAGPDRKEMMSRETIDDVLRVLEARRIATLDVTGGAPELNPHFRHLVHAARTLGVHVIDRCNLTVLNEPGFEDLAEFLAREAVEVTASLPCYTKENVDRQRGEHVFESSILGLQKLNALGYGGERTRPRAQSRLQPARTEPAARAGPARGRLQARARGALRHRVQSAVHARQHADQALRLDADHAGAVRELHGAAALRAQPGQPRRGHVPDAGVGRLSRPPVRLRLQPDARHTARRRRQAAPPPDGPADRRAGRRADLGRRSLLRLHRGTGVELRRRARRRRGLQRMRVIDHRSGAWTRRAISSRR